MTKQEKIREGVARQLYYWLVMAYRNEDNFNETAWESISEKDREFYREYYATPLMNSLHSQGVVIKVKEDSDPIEDMGIYPKSVVGGEHPYEERNDYQNGWNASLIELGRKMAEANIEYVAVEPLIKGECQ